MPLSNALDASLARDPEQVDDEHEVAPPVQQDARPQPSGAPAQPAEGEGERQQRDRPRIPRLVETKLVVRAERDADVQRAEQQRRRHDGAGRPHEGARPRVGLPTQDEFLGQRREQGDVGEGGHHQRLRQERRDPHALTEADMQRFGGAGDPGDVDRRPDEKQQPQPPGARDRRARLGRARQAEPASPRRAVDPQREADGEHHDQDLPQQVRDHPACGEFVERQAGPVTRVEERVEADPYVCSDAHEERREKARRTEDHERHGNEEQHLNQPGADARPRRGHPPRTRCVATSGHRGLHGSNSVVIEKARATIALQNRLRPLYIRGCRSRGRLWR